MSLPALELGWMIPVAGIAMTLGAVRLLGVQVEEQQAVEVDVRGRRTLSLTRAGWHFVPYRVLPGVRLRRVSLRWECTQLEGLAARAGAPPVDIWLSARPRPGAPYVAPGWQEHVRARVAAHARELLLGLSRADVAAHARRLGRMLGQLASAEVQRDGVELGAVFLRPSAPADESRVNA